MCARAQAPSSATRLCRPTLTPPLPPPPPRPSSAPLRPAWLRCTLPRDKSAEHGVPGTVQHSAEHGLREAWTRQPPHQVSERTSKPTKAHASEQAASAARALRFRCSLGLTLSRAPAPARAGAREELSQGLARPRSHLGVAVRGLWSPSQVTGGARWLRLRVPAVADPRKRYAPERISPSPNPNTFWCNPNLGFLNAPDGRMKIPREKERIIREEARKRGHIEEFSTWRRPSHRGVCPLLATDLCGSLGPIGGLEHMAAANRVAFSTRL